MPQQKLFEAAVMQSWNAIVITDADLSVGCRVQVANPAFLEMTGYSFDELKGRSLAMLQGPATDPQVIEELRTCLKKEKYFVGRTTNYRKDGSPYIVRWNISPVCDDNGKLTNFVSVQENVSERVRVERSNRLLARALDATSDMVMLTDAKGRIVFVNTAFESATGYSLSDLVGRTPALLRSGEHDEAFYEEMHRTISEGRDFRATFVNRRRDGSFFHVEQTISTIFDDAGHATHHISVSKDISPRVKREKALWRAATQDKLTGLYNRHYGEQTLQNAFLKAQEGHESLSLMIVDVDNFKQINDKYGHIAGDRILTAVSHILQGAVRSQDAVIRWGGDEFVIALVDCKIDNATELAERVRSRVDAYRDEEFGSITVSLGVASFIADETVNDLMARADESLYDAKRSGRNRVSVDMDSKLFSLT